MLYDRISDLEFSVESTELVHYERDTTSGFTRTTTVISLHGDDEVGRGEDVTYDSDAHYNFQETDIPDITGEYTIDEFSEYLGDIDWFFGEEPGQAIFRNYRQWAFESAALDLALKQADTTLANRLDRVYRPVRFAVSTRLDDPPTGERILDWLDHDSDLEFKLDPTSDWSTDLITRLADTDAVRVLDLKGQYHGTTVDQPADPRLYKQVIEGFPDALIEDPALTDETRPIFEGHEERVTWDYPIQSVESVENLPWEPKWLNIKPSRFGSVKALFDTLDYCEEHGIQMFGGGQFELDIGRKHLHAIASLFYPDAPNDVAPSGYNDPEPRDDLPSSPLDTPADPRGFEWE